MSECPALYDQLTRLFSQELHLDVPSPDTELLKDGFLDSLGFVNLLLHLERVFGIEVQLDVLEIQDFSSIVRIADFLVEHNHVAAGS